MEIISEKCGIDEEAATLQKEDALNTNEYSDYAFSLKRAGRLYQLKAREEAGLEEIKNRE